MSATVASYPHFRRILRALRTKRGWTQEQLAERARADYKYLQLVELGKTGLPSLELIDRLAKALGAKPWVLLCDDRKLVMSYTGLTEKELSARRQKRGRPRSPVPS